jgi:acyl carrier protein
MSVDAERDALRQELFAMVSRSTGGALESGESFGVATEFPDTGMTSISYLELIDGLETKYGVVVDLESDGPQLTSIDKVVDFLLQQGVAA